jgi:hypothetical protein
LSKLIGLSKRTDPATENKEENFNNVAEVAVVTNVAEEVDNLKRNDIKPSYKNFAN